MEQKPPTENPYLSREYLGRINRVMDYVETHLDEGFSLEGLADIAGFSRYHFHRLFTTIVGESLFHFIQRVRLERAAAWLVINPTKSITEIALDSGFSGPAPFSRAFRGAFGVSPSHWRRAGGQVGKPGKTNSKNGKEESENCPYSGSNMNERSTQIKNQGVRVETLPEMTLAYVRHVGPYQGDAELFERLWNKLMKWAGPRGLTERPEARYLIIYHDAPEITEEEKLRLSVCLSVPEDTEVEGDIGRMILPSGRYAMARFEVTPADYGAAWGWTYGVWLPESGYQPDDRPTFELYPEPTKIGPNGEMTVDIVVPVKPL